MARAERLNGAGPDGQHSPLPAILDGGQARALLDDWLSRKWAGRETTSLALGAPAGAKSPRAGSSTIADDDPRIHGDPHR